ncbi:efflux RND transporter permease subunit [Klebsiella pneumoniae]|uniref:efflux RND transporter permease subunit n=1 Tax=Klebsiella pneumoniae TaxID=573 RepID=UPI00296FE5E5|nr:efflux RND transporter permease subunit [Klebsiella pneumoniae]MDW3853700.1 efflux RND transporter permease subunit [Klebsiella pneumoniae]
MQNRLKKAEARMPQAVLTLGIQTEQATAGFLLIYALSYTDGDKDANVTALADYAARNINNEIRRVNGVGKLQFFASEAAMRVWIDPQKLVGYGLSIDDEQRHPRAERAGAGRCLRQHAGFQRAGADGDPGGQGYPDNLQEFAAIVLRANQTARA